MRCILLTLIASTVLVAQDAQVENKEAAKQNFVATRPSAIAAGGLYSPLTLRQSYSWSLHKAFNPSHLFFIGARTGLDHLMDSPTTWARESESYPVRAASRLGVVVVRENLAFAIRAIDGEDPRYFRSAQAGMWKRTRYALSRTFVARRSDGGTMPAYSTITAALATPFIAQTWQPESFDAGRESRTGAMEIGITAMGNIAQEFWPDIRRKLHR